jgi:hypothetical protein
LANHELPTAHVQRKTKNTLLRGKNVAQLRLLQARRAGEGFNPAFRNASTVEYGKQRLPATLLYTIFLAFAAQKSWFKASIGRFPGW